MDFDQIQSSFPRLIFAYKRLRFANPFRQIHLAQASVHPYLPKQAQQLILFKTVDTFSHVSKIRPLDTYTKAGYSFLGCFTPFNSNRSLPPPPFLGGGEPPPRPPTLFFNSCGGPGAVTAPGGGLGRSPIGA